MTARCTILAALLLGFAPNTFAGTLKGDFRLLKGEKTYATESYTLLIKTNEILGSSTTSRGAKKVLYAGFLQLGKGNRVEKFRLRMGGKKLVTTFLFRYKKQYRVRTSSGDKSGVSEVSLDELALVLDKRLVFPYLLAIRRYKFKTKGTQSFPFFDVPNRKSGTMTITHQPLSGGAAKHLLTLSGMGWTAKLTVGERQKLLKVEVDGGLTAVAP